MNPKELRGPEEPQALEASRSPYRGPYKPQGASIAYRVPKEPGPRGF